MKKSIFLLRCILILFSNQLTAQYNQNIIPVPVELITQNKPGTVIDSNTILFYPIAFEAQSLYLHDELKKQTGLDLTRQKTTDTVATSVAGIVLVYDSVAITRPEMYKLQADGKGVLISAKDIRGFVNAFQTLLQLLPLNQQPVISIPAVSITDYPQFTYRGMHLDVARHIFPVSYIKKYIDYLTFHKFNTFHWHLTDDQGWRFEVSAYPKINSIGSWRDSTLIGHFKDSPARYNLQRYGGFYTKAAIKEIVAYAGIRGITIIPELDIPGHSRAAIAAYPQLSTKPDTTWNVASTWGMYNRQNNVLAPNDFTFNFLKTVFKELTELFPSRYIHIGGDECSKLWWKQDTATQQFMRLKKIANEKALETYFISYIADYLKQLNRKAIGWHEIAAGDLDTSTLIMNWADDKQAMTAARKGFNIIMTPGKPFYFDAYQSKNPADSLAIHGYNPLEAVYNYSIVPSVVSSAALNKKIVGGQGNVWTEYMEYPTKVDYMIFPRMTALSENLWSKKKDYNDFVRRLEAAMLARYKWWGSSYFEAFRTWTKDK